LLAAVMLLVVAGASADISSGVWVRALCRAEQPTADPARADIIRANGHRAGNPHPKHTRTDGPRKAIALTFDDGPHPEHTPRVLDVLARRGVLATFFVVGERAAAHPDLVRRMVAEGHAVGNHTQSHSAGFPLLGTELMRRDIELCDNEIERLTGTRPALFRPPFGVTNPPLARALDGRTVAGWDVRSLDTVARWPREKVCRRVIRRLSPGSVVLLHDDRAGADRLVEMILDYTEQSGYTVARFDELFGI